MKISVFGLGYVGMVNLACFAKMGHQLVGCDIKPQKVAALQDGKSTVYEPGINEMLEKACSNELISATTKSSEAVAQSDLALVCVGTPSDAQGNVNLNYIFNTVKNILEALKSEEKPFTIAIRSTIPPGTINEHVLPAIEETKSALAVEPHIVFLPEFLREGNAVKDFFECSRVVIGMDVERKAERQMRQLFSFDDPIPIHICNYRTAEFVKYVDNAYHAAKVAFANELYSLGASMGVDVNQANELFLMDDILNISSRYLKPGMPFGGSCLPKDTRALLHLGKQHGVEVPFIEGLFRSNQAHQNRITHKVQSFGKQKVLLYGITFKQDTDDFRESSFIALLDTLLKEGREVRVYDPNLNAIGLSLDNSQLEAHLHQNLQEAMDWAEMVVINRKNYAELGPLANQNQVMLNCLNNRAMVIGKATVHNLYDGSWS